MNGTGSISVKSASNAELGYLYGLRIGNTPAVEVPSGRHETEVGREGYATSKGMVTVPTYEASSTEISVVKEKFGTLTIVPNPIEASVEVDGRVLGTGARTLDDVPIGRHEIIVREERYLSVKRTINVDADETAKVEVMLIPGDAPHPVSPFPRYAINTGVGLGGLALTGISIANYIQAEKAYELFLTVRGDTTAATVLSDAVTPARNRFIGAAIGAGAALAGSGALWFTTDFGAAPARTSKAVQVPPRPITSKSGTATAKQAGSSRPARSHVVNGVVIQCAPGNHFVQIRSSSATSHDAGCLIKSGKEQVRSGMWVMWPSSGPGHTTFTYVDGHKQGQSSQWANNESKLNEGEYLYDERVGKWRTWNREGRLTEEALYEDGIKHGVDRNFAEDGTVESTTYFHGAKTGLHSITNSGRIIEEGGLVDGRPDGLFKRYDNTGKLTEKSVYVHGKKSGVSTTYFANGNSRESTTYADDKPLGPFVRWYENGQLQEQGSLYQGRLQGPMQRWSAAGDKIFDGAYSDDKLEGLVSVWNDGVLQSRCTYSFGRFVGLCEEWYANGSRKSITTYSAEPEASSEPSILDGAYAKWNAEGIKIAEGTYSNGLKIGMWTFWDDGGNLIEKWSYAADGKDQFITGSPAVIAEKRAAAEASAKKRAAKQAAQSEAAAWEDRQAKLLSRLEDAAVTAAAARAAAQQAVQKVAEAEAAAAAKAAEAEAAAAAARQAKLLSRLADCVDQAVRSTLGAQIYQIAISGVQPIPEPSKLDREMMKATAIQAPIMELEARISGAPFFRGSLDDIGYMGHIYGLNAYNVRVSGGFGVAFHNVEVPKGSCPSSSDVWLCDNGQGCGWMARATRNLENYNNSSFGR